MRTLSIIGGIAVVAIALGCLLFFFGPPGLQTEVGAALQSSPNAISSQGGDVSFKMIAQGDHALSIGDRTNYRINSASDFSALWPLIYGTVDMPTIPSVDFSKYEVLAVFDGTHSTTGYSISVTNVMDQNATRTVTVTHTTPGVSCKTTSSGTSPFEIIEVPKTSYLLAHQDVAATDLCAGQ